MPNSNEILIKEALTPVTKRFMVQAPDLARKAQPRSPRSWGQVGKSTTYLPSGRRS